MALALLLSPSTALSHPGASWVPTLSVDPSSLPAIEGTVAPDRGQVDFGMALEWFDDPVPGAVGGRFLSTFSTQVGLGRRWALGLQLPVAGYQSSATSADIAPPGLGDARALVRWVPRTAGSAIGPTLPTGNACRQGRCSHNWSTGLAFELAATAPTSGVPFAGHGAPTARLDAAFELRSFRYGLVASVGYLLAFGDAWPAQDALCAPSDISCPVGVAQRDRLVLSIGLRHPVAAVLGFLGAFSPIFADIGTLLAFTMVNTIGSPYLTLVASLDGRDLFDGPAAVELGFGSQRRVGPFTITVGGACGYGGLLDGSHRVTIGLQWQPPGDEDRDGVGDDADECLGVVGTASLRGCPDERGDPDHDDLLFPADQCPTLPEDLNGLDDHDGCPDRDADGDGVPDARDVCPCAAAGAHSARGPERRGCPFAAPDSTDRACLTLADEAPPDGGVRPSPREGSPYSHEAR